ncbi:M20 family metallopeptidase [Persicobacter psychrovividus]|uniref:N-acyl-L-amino acid amidohydrolase n=1 Tax=Persicobacter psychrovividus TaxID=387638 RepID=A0ABN6LFU2_9BACT|nr:N-acyl-L-amino acid amidohydrolase [Persicobacter psychrovividus]
MKSTIQQLAKEIKQQVIDYRQYLHQHPELSFQEHHTVKYVADQLTAMGITRQETKAETGLVALIEGKNPTKKVIALRADLDALPIVEENDQPYKSQNDGVMHACGHDAHTASLLGAAYILNQVKDQFEGTVKLVFQPGEEQLPGGASLMIKDGALENPKPEAIIGQHVMPFIPVGKVGFRPGMYMASCDEIYITVRGKGGHAALPENNIDPIVIAANMIVSLQQIVSRFAPPKIPCVLSFGDIRAFGATNIIPDEVKIKGTFRTMNEPWRAEAHERIVKMAKGIVEGMGGTVDFDIRKGYPYLENDEALTLRNRAVAEEYLGEENVVDLDIWLGAEDFSYYTQEMKACFYRLGTRNEAKGITSAVHTPTFDIDHDALEIGSGLMAFMAFKELQG